MKANLVFNSDQVKAKKERKGVTLSTSSMSQSYLSKIGDYFNVDHVRNPQSRVLQHTIKL